MPLFNTNAYYLTPKRDPLYGNDPNDRPEQVIARDMHTRRPPAQRPTLRAAHNNALAGSRVSTPTRTGGGKFAPRAVSGMS
jgi:hypothetical protein